MKRMYLTMMGTACSGSSPSPDQSPGEPVIPLPLDILEECPTEHSVGHVPLDILEEIFLNLPPQYVVCVCRLVCRQWKDVADSESFWRERCRREGYHLRDPSRVASNNWRLFYFLCKKRRNLIKNPRAEDEFKGWKILNNGGDKWTIEGTRVQHSNPAVKKNYVTSYGWCTKEQVINLMKEGYSQSFMDEFQPPIRISDWYGARSDCGSIYQISVQLLDRKKNVLQDLRPQDVTIPQWNDQRWHQMEHVFKDYGPGVRYVRFTHGGKDTQFWGGWYGIRVTESCVEICPALDS